MPKEAVRPLWRLLLTATSQKEVVTLNCDECFLILEYLADMCVRAGVSLDLLRVMTQNHLSCCPDCREYYWQRVRQLEDLQLSTEDVLE